MKYRVTGSSKDTGARMTLELEARSKADAERKAQSSGMSVNRVEAEGSNLLDDLEVRRPRRRGPNKLLRVLILVVIAAGALYWAHSHGFMPAWQR